MNKTITRSTVNSQEYSAPEFPKSGFNLGYRDYNDYMLGRWQVSGFQHVMPSDKISGHNKGNFTFNRIVTPMVAPTHVGQYNVYCTYRSIDNTFQENVAPSKHNGYSADWRMPMTNTRYLVRQLLTCYGLASWFGDPETGIGNMLANAADADTTLLSSVPFYQSSYSNFHEYLYGNANYPGLIQTAINRLTNPAPSSATYVSLYSQAVNLYAVDALKDVIDLINSRLGTSSNPISLSTTVGEFLYNFFDCLLTPFVGRYSYFADFGYNFVRPSDIYRLAHGQNLTPIEGFDDLINCFDDTPMCEYALRAMYAFWYDRCRDVNLQPVSSTLPNPRKFGSTSIFDMSAGGNLMYLLYRIRRWTEDMFISAQCDSPARHVFAPVYTSSVTDKVQDMDMDNNYAHDSQGDNALSGRKISATTIEYINPLNGNLVSVTCPVPSFVNDSLSRLAGHESDLDVLGLSLQNLRQAQNYERYLKRLDYFGDEYNDYMLAQYNSRVSDLRINHPEVLSQSLDDANYEQEIANMSNGISNAGDRTATGTISSGGDGYTTFCEEFGIIINVISFMPEASYDNCCPQNLMSRLVDLPLPIFAANNDELGRIMEIAANGLSPALNGDDADFRFMFGHYPAYHAWRSRVDRVRGSFLNERQDCLFRRFYGMTDGLTTPRLNYEFINCRPNLQMFANTVRYDGQLYGDVVHECYVERVLPTPVETI